VNPECPIRVARVLGKCWCLTRARQEHDTHFEVSVLLGS